LFAAAVAPWAPRLGEFFPRALTVCGIFALVGASVWIRLSLERAAGPPFAPPSVMLRPVSPVLQNPDLRRVIEYLEQSGDPRESIWVARAEPLLYEPA
jgi:hypothetical protein